MAEHPNFSSKNVDIIKPDGGTYLHEAASEGQLNLCKWLVERKPEYACILQTCMVGYH